MEEDEVHMCDELHEEEPLDYSSMQLVTKQSADGSTRGS